MSPLCKASSGVQENERRGKPMTVGVPDVGLLPQSSAHRKSIHSTQAAAMAAPCYLTVWLGNEDQLVQRDILDNDQDAHQLRLALAAINNRLGRMKAPL